MSPSTSTSAASHSVPGAISLDAVSPGPVSLEVLEVHRPTSDSVHIVLRQPVPALVNAAGQYLTVLADVEGKPLARNYSLTTTPDLDGTLAIVVKRTPGGRMSNHLNDTVRAGQRLSVRPPAGSFGLTAPPPTGRTVVLLAAGSGITPLYAMARAVLVAEPSSRVALVYANVDVTSIIFRVELEQMRQEHDGRLTVTHILEHPGALQGALPGRLTPELAALLLREHAAGPTAVEYYVCGPGGFMDTACAALLHLAVPDSRVRVERFTAPGPPSTSADSDDPDEGRIYRVLLEGAGGGRRLSVPASETLLDVVEGAGLFVPYSCRVGDCGTCKVRLVRGSVTMANLDGLSEDDEAAGYVLACVARPTSDVDLHLP